MIDWSIDWLIGRSIDWLIDWSIDWLIDVFRCARSGEAAAHQIRLWQVSGGVEGGVDQDGGRGAEPILGLYETGDGAAQVCRRGGALPLLPGAPGRIPWRHVAARNDRDETRILNNEKNVDKFATESISVIFSPPPFSPPNPPDFLLLLLGHDFSFDRLSVLPCTHISLYFTEKNFFPLRVVFFSYQKTNSDYCFLFFLNILQNIVFIIRAIFALLCDIGSVVLGKSWLPLSSFYMVAEDFYFLFHVFCFSASKLALLTFPIYWSSIGHLLVLYWSFIGHPSL